MSKTPHQPQYMQIYESLRNEIINEKMSAGERLPSIRSFSKDWGVSNITTIKAFDKLKEEGLVTTNERSGFFVAEKKRSLSSAKKVGFLSPVKPQELHKHKNIHDACSRLQESLRAAGHYLSVHIARWGAQGGNHEYLSAQAITEYGLDAIVLIDIYNYHYLSSLTELNIPILILDADATHLGIDSVFFDNTQAAMDMSSTLIENAASNILFVGGPEPHVRGTRQKIYYDPATAQRVDGCRLASHTGKAHFHEAYSETERSGEQWAEAANAYLAEHQEIDAIISESPLQLDADYEDIPRAVFCSEER
ncbi:MAG: GntR family transcriptional regulator, partial [Planctomycetes bacterium]|nr:GntR family transcriptional regulator [Planctomycetota bacterium]